MRTLLLIPLLLGMARPPVLGNSVTVPLPPARPVVALPPIMGPPGRPLVLLDPGHGGHDPGARGGDGTLEKDFTLRTAERVARALVAGGRVRVALTRSTDRYLTLRERAELATVLKADLFLSLHADSAPDEAAAGVTLYMLGTTASDPAAAALAARENRADIVKGVDLGAASDRVAAMLGALSLRRTSLAAARFAELMRREADPALPFRPDYLRRAGFAVLRAGTVPAVLIEAGYLSNPADESRMTSADGQRAFADAIARAAAIFAAERNAR